MQINGVSQVHAVQQVKPSERFVGQSQSPQQPTPARGPDELQISEEAQLISQTRELPEIREDRVAAIRAEIANGTYETDEKLDLALGRLLDEIG